MKERAQVISEVQFKKKLHTVLCMREHTILFTETLFKCIFTFPVQFNCMLSQFSSTKHRCCFRQAH